MRKEKNKWLVEFVFSQKNYNGNIESVVAELVRAAHFIKETTGEKIQAVVVAKDCDHLVKQLEQFGIDEVYAVKADRECAFQDDALSQVIAEMIQRIDPSSVLIPATPTGALHLLKSCCTLRLRAYSGLHRVIGRCTGGQHLLYQTE